MVIARKRIFVKNFFSISILKSTHPIIVLFFKYFATYKSWSSYWGNDGYVLVSSDSNMCGILDTPTYPIVV